MLSIYNVLRYTVVHRAGTSGAARTAKNVDRILADICTSEEVEAGAPAGSRF